MHRRKLAISCRASRRELAGSILSICQPARQFDPTALPLGNLRGHIADHSQEAARDLIPQTIKLPSKSDRFVGGSVNITGDHRARRDLGRGRKFGLYLSEQFLLQNGALLFLLASVSGAGCDGVSVLSGKFFQRVFVAALQKLQSGFRLFFALLKFRLLAPIRLIGRVQLVGLGTDGDESAPGTSPLDEFLPLRAENERPADPGTGDAAAQNGGAP